MALRNFLKTAIVWFDNLFNTNLYDGASRLEESFNGSDILNGIRRRTSPAAARLKYVLGLDGKRPIKLHLGCGSRRIEGYINVDWRRTGATDLVCDIRRLPYPDGSASRVESYHVIEHLPRHNAEIALKEWRRVLMPGGTLVIECPDFDQAVKEYIEGNEKRIDNIFGLQRFPGDTHLFGYNFKRLKEMLEASGFKDIQRKDPTDYHVPEEPCLRVEAVKG